MATLAPAAAVLLALTAAPSAATALQVRATPRFSIVHTERARGAAEYLATRIEGIRDEVALAVGRDWPGTTEVRLGFGREEYEALALPGGRPPPWAAALAYPERNVILLEAHSLAQLDGQATLRHELVHVALGQLGSGWPRWFQEGVAMSLTRERHYRFSQYATLAGAVASGGLFDFEDLALSFPSRPEDVDVAYAQSVAFVDFLRSRHGPDAFERLIERVQAGDRFERAFGVAFHASLGTEERDFRVHLRHRYPWWPLLVSGGSLVWVLAAVLLVVAELKHRRQVATQRRELARVERLEDLAQALLERRDAPANEDVAAGGALGASNADATWLVHALQTLGPRLAEGHLTAPRPPGT